MSTPPTGHVEAEPHSPQKGLEVAAERDLSVDYSPWLYWSTSTADDRETQERHRRNLARAADVHVHPSSFVSTLASVTAERLRLGARSYVAAHAYVTGTVTTGDDCTVNAFSVVRGSVVMGNGVRIGAHTSVLGFNHSIDPALPVHRQPLVSVGIVIGDDVWVGSNAVVLDGVTLGDHCVVAAGAVVTRSVPAWAIVGGNPARMLRDRRNPRSPNVDPDDRLATRLVEFADRARAQAGAVLSRSWKPGADGGFYVDRPGAAATVRAHCDAVEIADLLLGAPPPQLSKQSHVQRLREQQDPASGLVPLLGPDGRPLADPLQFRADEIAYHVLCVGYALDVLGSAFAWPVSAVGRMSAAETVAALQALPWASAGWGSGAWVDAWATAAHWNLQRGDPGEPGALEALFGWLLTHVHSSTGTWGTPTSGQARLQVINGYYRLTRGSFAQFGVPVPVPERLVNAVLDHAQDPRYFAPGRQNACNVLDVAHPLWLAGRQTDHRSADVRSWAHQQLEHVLGRWEDGAGMSFSVEPEQGVSEPGLQGTEMWLSITWYLADLLGLSQKLGYRPRGVHRPEPARSTPSS